MALPDGRYVVIQVDPLKETPRKDSSKKNIVPKLQNYEIVIRAKLRKQMLTKSQSLTVEEKRA